MKAMAYLSAIIIILFAISADGYEFDLPKLSEKGFIGITFQVGTGGKVAEINALLFEIGDQVKILLESGVPECTIILPDLKGKFIGESYTANVLVEKVTGGFGEPDVEVYRPVSINFQNTQIQVEMPDQNPIICQLNDMGSYWQFSRSYKVYFNISGTIFIDNQTIPFNLTVPGNFGFFGQINDNYFPTLDVTFNYSMSYTTEDGEQNQFVLSTGTTSEGYDYRILMQSRGDIGLYFPNFSYRATFGSTEAYPILENLKGYVITSIFGVQTPLPGAIVKITEIERSTTSDEKGYFSFKDVPPNQYSIRVQRDYFSPVIIEGISVKKGETTFMPSIELSDLNFCNQNKFDINGDQHMGLEEVIYILRKITGQ